jgi:hypothetical protein
MRQNNKKAFTLMITTFVIFFIILTIGYYIKFNLNITSKEFHKNLATIRGYWAVWGAKENNANSIYKYYRLNENKQIYSIKAIKNNNTTYKWELDTTNGKSGIEDDDLFHRVLKIDTDKKIEKYEK